MPEFRDRRPKKKPNQKNITNISKKTPTKKEDKETSNPKPGVKRFRPLDIWKNVWAVLGPGIALTGFSFLLWPQVKIEPSVNPNPTDPIGTEFIVINSGNVPVYNVRFSCGIGIGGEGTYIGRARVNTAATLSPVAVLPPGVSVAKSCVVSSEGSIIPNLEITATYKWPIIWKESSKNAFFRVIRGTNGTAYLLPDLLPPRAH